MAAWKITHGMAPAYLLSLTGGISVATNNYLNAIPDGYYLFIFGILLYRFYKGDSKLELMLRNARLLGIKSKTRPWITNKSLIISVLLCLQGVTFIWAAHNIYEDLVFINAIRLILLVNILLLGFENKSLIDIRECIREYFKNGIKYKTRPKYNSRIDEIKKMHDPVQFWLGNNIFCLIIISIALMLYSTYGTISLNELKLITFVVIVINSYLDFRNTTSMYSM